MDSHLKKAPSPIILTPSGITTFSKVLQRQKASAAIPVTPCGIDTSVTSFIVPKNQSSFIQIFSISVFSPSGV